MAFTNPIESALPRPSDDMCEVMRRIEQARIQFYHRESVPAATALLRDLKQTPWRPTATKPVLIFIGKILYISYTGDDLAPVNEVERSVDNWRGGARRFTVGAGKTEDFIVSTLPAQPYDRMITATVSAWGRATQNSHVAIALTEVDGTVKYESKFEAGSAGEGNALTGIFRVYAGQAPRIKAVIYGSYGEGGTVEITADAKHNALITVATPVSMHTA